MTIEVDDIREVLRGVTDAMVPDNSVSFWINVATMIVEANIGETVTEDDKNTVIKVLGSFYTLQSYATYLQTSTARVPNAIMGQMSELSKASSVLLSIISRAEGPMAPPMTLIETSKSLYDV
jgi:hypothetical protein